MEKLNLNQETEKTVEDTRKRDKAIGETALEENWRVESVANWAGYYHDTERAFLKHRKHVSRPEYEDLEEWEDHAAISFNNMQKSEKGAHFPSRYERDRVERIGTLDPDESIEGYSGIFYQRRQRALNRAIEDSDNEDKEKDIHAGEDLYRLVNEHLYYEHDYDTRQMDPKYYQSKRRAAHNALINHLNHMNDLARKYGVRPFTFRNFEDNDFPYSEKLDIGGYTNGRAEFDRSAVEAYCRNAFSSAYEKAEKDNR